MSCLELALAQVNLQLLHAEWERLRVILVDLDLRELQVRYALAAAVSTGAVHLNALTG